MNNIDIANGIIFEKWVLVRILLMNVLFAKRDLSLQSLGTDFGYSYNWYLRGQYSPALANYVYSNIEILSNTDFNDYKISESAEKNIK